MRGHPGHRSAVAFFCRPLLRLPSGGVKVRGEA